MPISRLGACLLGRGGSAWSCAVGNGGTHHVTCMLVCFRARARGRSFVTQMEIGARGALLHGSPCGGLLRGSATCARISQHALARVLCGVRGGEFVTYYFSACVCSAVRWDFVSLCGRVREGGCCARVSARCAPGCKGVVAGTSTTSELDDR